MLPSAHAPELRCGIENDATTVTTYLGAARDVHTTTPALATHAHIAPALATDAFGARYPAHAPLNRRCGIGNAAI
jgi:hypothetical protein